MPSRAQWASVLKRTDVIVAIIGLVGVLATAVFSNWSKLFPDQGVVTASYSGYKPTNDFETDFRYYVDVSSLRRTMEARADSVRFHA
jgi:hypothetical protein